MIHQYSWRSFKPGLRLRIFLTLAAVWCGSVALLALCQFVGLPLGINVHPTGEDRVWIDLLDRPYRETAQGWWAIASRNPLAPWWYQSASPLIDAFPGGLYLARKMLDLFLAGTIALFVNELMRGRRPILALGFGLLVMFWNFSGYVEQILFVMLVSLGFSVLSLHFYACYLNSRRMTGEWLALSILTFLIALSTYSIQCGVPLAIAIMSVAYGRDGLPDQTRVGPIIRTIIDVAFYTAIFVIFTLIWITASGPTSSFFHLEAGLFLKHLWLSIANHLWHADTSALVDSLFSAWSWLYIILTTIAAGGLFFVIVRRFMKKCEPQDLDRQDVRMIWTMGLLAITVVCLVIPTVLLECTSDIWFPGSRSRMVQQVFQPVIYLVALFGVSVLLRRYFQRPIIVPLIISMLCAAGFVLGMEYNRQLRKLSDYENGLVRGLQNIVPRVVGATRFVVRIDNEGWYSGHNAELNRILMKKAYGSAGVTLDAVFKGVVSPEATMILGPDEKGLFSPALRRYVPYDQVVFASYDGVEVTPLQVVDGATFSGYPVRYDRRDPRRQGDRASPDVLRNSTAFEFDCSPHGTGWSDPEVSGSGETFVWMASKTARVTIGPLPTGSKVLRFRILQPIATDVRDSLKLEIDNQPVSLDIVDRSEEKWEYSALLPGERMSSSGDLTLVFSVARTVAPIEGGRELALPFDWIRIEQKGDIPPSVSK